MTEEIESRVDPRDHAPAQHYGETLLYDLAKFLTTLSLLAIGGILTLTLTQAAAKGLYQPNFVLLVLGAIALAGVMAFGTAFSLAEARSKQRDPHGHLSLLLQAATSLLGLGTGGFVWMWWTTLA
jgi:hypothetical protein